ncbi:hypothetical protein ACKKBG_A29375 [Auxenochlorella protothecoides x Auxenochlorella symbiontica]
MPALRVFGRRWLIASDDIPIPAGFLAIFRFIWCGLLVGWLISIHGPKECTGAWQYNVAAGGLLGFFLASFALETAMTIIGLRGSIFETSKRRRLPLLIYLDIVAVTGQIAFNAYCTRLLYTEPPQCEVEPGELWQPAQVLKGLVWSTWAVLAGSLLLLALTYNLYPDYKAVESWERRWSAMAHCCFCCISNHEKGRREDLAARLGRIFALMFGHIDMTASDIVVSFALAMTLQKLRRRGGSRAARAGSLQMTTAALPGADPYRAPSPSSSGAGAPLMDGTRTGEGGNGPRFQGASAGPTGVGGGSPGSGAGPSPWSDSEGSDDEGLAAADEEAGLQGQRSRVDAETLQEASHYMSYAFAAYGYLLYLWGKPATGVLELCCGRSCGLAMNMLRPSRGVLPDLRVITNLNREATLQAAGLSTEDLLFVRYEAEKPNVLPYFLALDHATQTVVLAIRGSLSLDDVVRDLLIEPASLDSWISSGKEWHGVIPEIAMAERNTEASGHAGILEAARATLMDLQESGYLWSTLLGPEATHRGWQLVVTGHSLGAGCAFLVGLYLSQSICPGLKCWAFSPPGGLASASVGASAKAWCTTVVCGKEWIPRLTAQSFDRLRDEMVLAALRCRLPKLAFGWGVLRRRAWTEADLVLPEVPPHARPVLNEYRKSLARRGELEDSFYDHASSFAAPGRVMWLQSVGSAPRKGWRPGRSHEYRAVWIDAEDLSSEGIILSGRMMADHMPDHLLALLRKMARRLQHSHSTAAVDDRAGESVLPHAGGSHDRERGG